MYDLKKFKNLRKAHRIPDLKPETLLAWNFASEKPSTENMASEKHYLWKYVVLVS